MLLRTRITVPLASLSFPILLSAMDYEQSHTDDRPSSQIALLLDTSGSMHGLIDQARFQLWNAVSELANASRDGKVSNLQIAVYQYGTALETEKNGYVHRVIDFTDNLDDISKALFSLTTANSSGEEYCGAAIDQALTSLSWSPNSGVYKAIFIAGNESFDQGPVAFGKLWPKALSENIIVNSLYCYDSNFSNDGGTTGMKQWQAAAKLTYGMYFQIDHNHHLPNIKTPFDRQMKDLNEKMNDTFVWYGSGSQEVSHNQRVQDDNAAKMSDHAFAARMSAKIGHLYHHDSHDLVDAVSRGRVDLATIPENQLPKLMRTMTPNKRTDFVNDKLSTRNHIRREMTDLITKRNRYLQSKLPNENNVPLGEALINTLKKQTKDKGFIFDRKTISFLKK